MNNVFEVVFLGTSGSCAYNNRQRTHYGTNTPCIAVNAGENTIIFDAGTGLCGYQAIAGVQRKYVNVLLSHYHTDHLSGLLFWDMLFNPDAEVCFHGMGDVRSAMDGFITKPYAPIGLNTFSAKLTFTCVLKGDTFQPCSGVTVKCMGLSHPGGCMGYRMEYGGKSICYLTDIELSDHENDDNLLAFAANTDLLITDASFADGKKRNGWGHSTPGECAVFSKRADVKRLALFHYDHLATDDDIQALEKNASLIFCETFAPADGSRITL